MSTTPVFPAQSTPPAPPAPGAQPHNRALLWGAILIVAGLMTLASNLGWLNGVGSALFAVLFAAGGLAFFYVFLRDTHRAWWAALPAFALFALAGTIMVTSYAPANLMFMEGAVFLGGLGLGFALVYWARRDFWWAIIPSGVLLSLAGTAAVSESPLGMGRDTLSGAIFLLGLALTFAVVALAPRADGRMHWWAFIPAGVLAVVGTAVLTQSTAYLGALNVVWAGALIAAGVYLLLKALGQRNG